MRARPAATITAPRRTPTARGGMGSACAAASTRARRSGGGSGLVTTCPPRAPPMASPSAARRASYARCARSFTAATVVPSTWAASAMLSPSFFTSSKATRCAGGSFASSRSRRAASCRACARSSAPASREAPGSISAVRREQLAPAPAHAVDQEPTGDGERPRHHLGTRDEAGSCAMNLQERLLQDVLGARPSRVWRSR